MKIKTLNQLPIILMIFLLTSCSNKINEICDCYKKAANTFMIKGEKPSDEDMNEFCPEFAGALKGESADEKRRMKDSLESIHKKIDEKILFTDFENVTFAPLPCGKELIQSINKINSEKLQNYYLKNREIECQVAVFKKSITKDGEFRVTGLFFDDKNVFEYGSNSFLVYIVLPKDESDIIMEAVKKEDIYPDFKTQNQKNFQITIDGEHSFKQILKFKGKNMHISGAYGLSFNFIIADEYEFVIPNKGINKQQHNGFNDFIFEGSTTQTTEQSKKNPEATKEKTNSSNNNITGLWVGSFGKDQLTINIETIGSDGAVIGYDEVKGNKRNLTGTKTGNSFTLNEPGDDKWDGVFTFNFNENTNKLKGEWKSNNGKSKKNFELTRN